MEEKGFTNKERKANMTLACIQIIIYYVIAMDICAFALRLNILWSCLGAALFGVLFCAIFVAPTIYKQKTQKALNEKNLKLQGFWVYPAFILTGIGAVTWTIRVIFF
jgi:hypothetical protein